ncbi:cytochrome P450 [Murinocardiopsis flavida]|uniref:Cytochrome P450 n=1 Tax=Murinocardiopsis flavida TaxID=645275 RepID=A0A2P8DS16_9ACTN|nr:cytochrome P450 [Murinocardiopsis flavida]PSL00002.1 cytochrome P450 [Murinocardiopsis flavida]
MAAHPPSGLSSPPPAPEPSPPGPHHARGTANAADFGVDPLGFLTRCAREYGDVVALTPANVLIVHPDDIGRALVHRRGDVVKISAEQRPRGPTGFPLAMMNSEGASWERKRSRLRPAFRSDRLEGLDTIAREAVARTVDRWSDGATIDVHAEMSRLAMHIGAVHLAGRPLGAEADALADAVAAIMRLTGSPIRLPGWLPSPTGIRLRRALRALDTALAALIEGHPADDTVTALGRLVAERADTPFAEIRDELATLLMSGYETTADALTWLVHGLGGRPEADALLAADARDHGAAASGAGGTGGANGPGGYAAAAAKEALRLYPPAWVISRVAVRPIELGGYRLAAGTTIGISQWVTHRDERWFDAPAEFRPERWLRQGAPGHRYAYLPFGAGPRGCLGASMAVREIEAVARALRSRVRLEPVAPGQVRPRPALALQPCGVRATVRRERAAPR